MSKETKDKMPDEWERAYAEAYPDRLPEYVETALQKPTPSEYVEAALQETTP